MDQERQKELDQIADWLTKNKPTACPKFGEGVEVHHAVPNFSRQSQAANERRRIKAARRKFSST